MVHRMLLMRVGGRYVHLLKMFGALFTFASAFFVLNAAYELNQTLKTATLLYPVTAGDIFGAITAPIASLFLWLAMMVLGLTLYRSDRTILPLEEDIEDLPFSPPVISAPGTANVGRRVRAQAPKRTRSSRKSRSKKSKK